MNNYLKYVSIDKQWDIMHTVIKVYGHRSDIIVEMVRDGYAVSIELLELLYRLRSFEIIKRIMVYDEAVYNLAFKNSAKMALLEKAFGEAEAKEFIDKLVNARSKEKEAKEQEKLNTLDEMLKNLYDIYGFEDEFFVRISATDELLKRAIKVYDAPTVIKGVEKIGKGHLFATIASADELYEAGLYKRVLSRLWQLYEYQRDGFILKIAKTDEGLRLILDSKEQEMRKFELCLGKTSSFKERLKKCGSSGYDLLYRAENMTIEEFEEWCALDNSAVKHYKEFSKNIFWVIKNGYFKQLMKSFS